MQYRKAVRKIKWSVTSHLNQFSHVTQQDLCVNLDGEIVSIQSSSQNNELIHISYALRGAEVNIGQCSTPFQKATQYQTLLILQIFFPQDSLHWFLFIYLFFLLKFLLSHLFFLYIWYKIYENRILYNMFLVATVQYECHWKFKYIKYITSTKVT